MYFMKIRNSLVNLAKVPAVASPHELALTVIRTCFSLYRMWINVNRDSQFPLFIFLQVKRDVIVSVFLCNSLELRYNHFSYEMTLFFRYFIKFACSISSIHTVNLLEIKIVSPMAYTTQSITFLFHTSRRHIK